MDRVDQFRRENLSADFNAPCLFVRAAKTSAYLGINEMMLSSCAIVKIVGSRLVVHPPA
jgi:hypothetical protein